MNMSRPHFLFYPVHTLPYTHVLVPVLEIYWKPGGGPTQFRGDQRSGGGERVVAAFCFCGARGRVRAGAALKWLFVPVHLGRGPSPSHPSL